MAIRRFREHVADHNWFAVMVDVGIVVLGVFLGLQVSNWNQARIEAAQARDYRERLIGELDFDARQYALQLAYYRQAREYGLQALGHLNGTKPLSDRDFVVAAYQLTQTDTTRPKTGVYEEMAANGLVGQLGDDETQQLASDFYISLEVAQRSLESTFPYRTILREVMPYGLQSRIRSECGDRNVLYKSRLVGIRTVVPCPMAIDAAEAADAAGIVRSTAGIEREMTRYVASLDEKLDNLDVALEQSRAFRDRLIRASGGSSA
ncbi:MAG TPA: hypothetical protein VFP53_03270 [Sphingomicrobium sp.]|nr:hypothetical protein [Sphingomicrobium sp.]